MLIDSDPLPHTCIYQGWPLSAHLNSSFLFFSASYISSLEVILYVSLSQKTVQLDEEALRMVLKRIPELTSLKVSSWDLDYHCCQARKKNSIQLFQFLNFNSIFQFVNLSILILTTTASRRGRWIPFNFFNLNWISILILILITTAARRGRWRWSYC